MGLPFDYARCMGTLDPLCETCRRKEQGHDEYQWFIAPEMNKGKCEYRIVRNDEGETN